MRRKLTAVGATLAVVGAMFAAVTGLSSPAVAARPAGPTDASKVPHYFGPWPNWALSPLTVPNAEVAIVGDGTGATATATVDLDGAVTDIQVVEPGSGYTTATVTVTSANGGSGATATAALSTTSGVVSYTVTPDVGAAGSGGGYKAFDVAVTGGGTGATATGSGGVDAIHVVGGGRGYTQPTVEFDLPDDPDGRIAKAHVPVDTLGPNGEVTTVVVDDAGSGYLTAPGVTVHNGTVYDPISLEEPATVASTLTLTAVTPVDLGAGYSAAPTVTVTDPVGSGTGAAATGVVDIGAVTGITVDTGGSGYMTYGMKKFQDQLPTTCDPSVATVADGGCPSFETDPDAKYIPVGVPTPKTYGAAPEADEYEIGLVQYRTSFSSDLPPTLTRGYVQLETPENATWSQHVPLFNELMDGTLEPTGRFGVTPPQYLGPFIAATKDRPVRIVFRNLLPKGADGDLFLPVDTSMMGSGMGPMGMPEPERNDTVMDEVRNPVCTQEQADGDADMCFKDNRATLHLHGGVTPWISDGTPHQWITPSGEDTAWPQGVSVQNVPDMDVCTTTSDGCQTFYYTNQQSARLMFYHDHSWGITRLNVYAGEAAGYVISDETEQQLISSGAIPGAADTIPLIVQDKTFVPDAAQLALQDPTWDTERWGAKGSFWYHHVYMPAQNPGDPSGMSAYGRWMYGPWFWPPATGTKYGPIPNPYYDATCQLDIPATWTYDTDPFCEPEFIPGTPNISAGMEQFNDTPLVNGVAYPTVTLEPKSYRMRLLNAANDRFFNLQWYTADTRPANGGDGGSDGTEVELNQAELDAAQTNPNVFPTPVGANDDAYGPDWIQIGSEGGFLPAPAVVDGQQPTTWITDPTRFDVGNVDQHSMLIAPAERADAIVDFSKFAGKTLILYNDAPAAFPARVPSYDYYTGQPDLSPNGAPGVLPGYGPNTRTVMKVKIAAAAPAPAFNLTKLRNAFKHNANGTGVFESGQPPVIVGQSTYNSAYGSSFAAASDCNAPNSTVTRCDGMVRVDDTAQFSFNTLRAQSSKMTIPLQPKGIHDEMNSSTFDEFGRMQANLGIEAQPPAPGQQNITLYPFVNPPTEMIDTTNLPNTGVKVTPISRADDGTQIWRVTHNGVDTHPIHFHLYDVQVINRVTWDNIVIPPDPNELGWKDTVRMAPLEDTIVALRPIMPTLPFEVPNSLRMLNPMMDEGSTAMFNSTNVQGQPAAQITNRIVNFGWEYVWHCHILSHEEMDMMRPVSVAVPPIAPDSLAIARVPDGAGERFQVGWKDNSITETEFQLQRRVSGGAWETVATSPSPVDVPNTHGTRTLVDPTSDTNTAYEYQVVARNTVGYGGDYPEMTVQSVSAPLATDAPMPPLAPSGLTATLSAGPNVNLAWTDNSTNETGFDVERSTDAGTTWDVVASVAPNATTAIHAAVANGTYLYRVTAVNAGGRTSSDAVTVVVEPPAQPTNLTAVLATGPAVSLTWTDNAVGETGYSVRRSTDGGTTWSVVAANLPADAGSWSDGAVVAGSTYTYQVGAVNAVGTTWSASATAAVLAPATPTGLTAALQVGPAVNLSWTDAATNETAYLVQRAANGGTWQQLAALPAGATSYTDNTGLVVGTSYAYRVAAQNVVATSWSASVTLDVAVPQAPSSVSATLVPATLTTGVQVDLGWLDNATNETGFVVQRSTNGGPWLDVTTVGARTGTGAMTATDTAPLAGVTHQYRIGAVNQVGTAWSPTVSVTLVPLPAAPVNLRVEVLSGPRIQVTWTDAATNETGFSVQRSTDGGATWTQVSTSGALTGTGRTRNFTQSVTSGQTYVYRVGARNASGFGYSAAVQVTAARPGTPAIVSATATATSGTREQVAVTWSDVANETDYRFQWGTAPNRISGTVTLPAGTTSYTRTNLTKRVWYVRVGARNGLGTDWSAWQAVPAAP